MTEFGKQIGWRTTLTARSRWLRRLAVAGAALAAIVVCVICVVALLPVDTDSVERAVERHFAQLAGGEVAYESASLDFFPHPRVALSGITVRVPGAVSGRIAALHVQVAWLPLLFGEISPTAVRIARPVLEARIAPGTTADPLAAYRAALGPITAALAARTHATPADMLAQGLEYQEITAAGALEASRVRLFDSAAGRMQGGP